jgi:hypothetical protein
MQCGEPLGGGYGGPPQQGGQYGQYGGGPPPNPYGDYGQDQQYRPPQNDPYGGGMQGDPYYQGQPHWYSRAAPASWSIRWTSRSSPLVARA